MKAGNSYDGNNSCRPQRRGTIDSESSFTTKRTFKNGPSAAPDQPPLLCPDPNQPPSFCPDGGAEDGAEIDGGPVTFLWKDVPRAYEFALEIFAPDLSTRLYQHVIDPKATSTRIEVDSVDESLGRVMYWRIRASNELGSTYSEVRKLTNLAAERCAVPLAVGANGLNDVCYDGSIPNYCSHVDVCVDDDEVSRVRLIDKTRRLDRDVHAHHGAMATSHRDTAGIVTADYRAEGNDLLAVAWSGERVGAAFWSSPDVYTRHAISAHVNSARVYDYLRQYANRNGFDDQGGLMLLYTEAIDEIGYDNAAFEAVQKLMFVGAASLSRRYFAGSSLDVIAHEWGHGVTSHAAVLSRFREGGALNEAFSDWMAVAVSKAYGRFNWTVGEEAGQPFRDLANPRNPATRGGPSPDTYLDDPLWYPAPGVYVDGCVVDAMNDGCGVHTNAGVPNKAFYLLANGGDHNGVHVDGIGVEKAFMIALEANKEEWRSLPKNIVGGASGMVKAALRISGVSSFEQLQVRLAWDAVKVLSRYSSDCAFDGRVDLGDINRAVSIALAKDPLSFCRTADRDGDRQVTVDELIGAGLDARASGGRAHSGQPGTP